LRKDIGDQIVKRRDGFYAYQLAVVLDDIEQQITHVIRGRDLLEVTAQQIFFFEMLNTTPPEFGHLPLALMPNKQKLSKQNLTPALDNQKANHNLWQALVFLGQNPPIELESDSIANLLTWATANWQLKNVPKLDQLIFSIKEE